MMIKTIKKIILFPLVAPIIFVAGGFMFVLMLIEGKEVAVPALKSMLNTLSQIKNSRENKKIS
ncbi:MAG: hypothetical protein ACJAY9_000749 [Flavobacteriales bacterium]|jgi:hypothetical protein